MSSTTIRSQSTSFTPAVSAPSFFGGLIKSLSARLERGQRKHEEYYLAQSSDRFELELRMRELDRGNPGIHSMIGMTA